MISALDPSRKTSFHAGADACTTMAADVEKRPQRPAPVPSDDDAFSRDFADKIVTRHWDLIDATGAEPRLAEKAFQLLIENIAVCVIARG